MYYVTGEVVCGHVYNNEQNSLFKHLSAYDCGRRTLAANLRMFVSPQESVFPSKHSYCVHTYPWSNSPDPLSVQKYKSWNRRLDCKRVVSTNCQINKSEYMILQQHIRCPITSDNDD